MRAPIGADRMRCQRGANRRTSHRTRTSSSSQITAEKNCAFTGPPPSGHFNANFPRYAMGLLDIFSSKPPQQPQGGLLGQQPAQPNLRDQWLRYNQDAMEQGNPRLKYEEWLKQQQAQPAPQK